MLHCSHAYNILQFLAFLQGFLTQGRAVSLTAWRGVKPAMWGPLQGSPSKHVWVKILCLWASFTYLISCKIFCASHQFPIPTVTKRLNNPTLSCKLWWKHNTIVSCKLCWNISILYFQSHAGSTVRQACETIGQSRHCHGNREYRCCKHSKELC